MLHLEDAVVRTSIEQRLARLTAAQPAQWGRMSAHEAVCHLSDSFRFALGEKPASPASGPLQRTLVKWIALHTPLPWPKGVPTRPEMQQGLGGTPPGEFARDKAALSSVMSKFTSVRDFPWEHPIFGRLTTYQWMRWGYLHMDHHLRQFGC